MDEAKKRASREAALGRLVIARVGLPAAPIKVGGYAVEHGHFKGLVKSDISEKYELVELDKALARTVDGQALGRERTYAEVGREVCVLIEMARLWVESRKKTPAGSTVKFPVKSKIEADARDMAKAARTLIEQLEDFNNQWEHKSPAQRDDGSPVQWRGSPYLERQEGISHAEILRVLRETEKHFREEIPKDADRINGPDAVASVSFVGMLDESFKQLFGVRAGSKHTRDGDHERILYAREISTYEGPFLIFAKLISDCAGLNLSAATIARYLSEAEGRKGTRSKNSE